MSPGGPRPILDHAPSKLDRRCPSCGEVGVPDSVINVRLWFCSGCETHYVLKAVTDPK
jgi:ribosomal protein L37AE/L43A